jgi:hypothetical protein
LTENQELFTLDKNIWTQHDFEQMGWHDSNIYGLSFFPVDENGNSDLLFDIDYIFKWVNPIPPKQIFSFWVAPCTLVFKDTFDLIIDVNRQGGTADMLEIADLTLIDKIEQEPNKWIYNWNIELHEGNINFKSSGFKQIVRQNPVFTDSQCLTLDERNGISFSIKPFKL